ncbi:hypothetical protein EPI10_030482 [Gossypium australe]|uniref:Mitochondrial protein n=1 Tax=Gossypium australe TaxID=47621 RepID=A0A5B6WXC7_9ROSI|nr:hypothetical protein EPI10_030482 [Gossypium australe]
MSDLGDMTYFLSLEVFQSEQGIFISQKSFALNILNRFCMENCKPTSTPIAQGEKLANQGSLEKVDECTYRKDSKIRQRDPKLQKRILRYVKGTLSYKVEYVKEKELKLTGFRDSD